MAYSAAWSEAVPVGTINASDLDQAIRDAKRDIRERIVSMFGLLNFTDDPLVPQSVTLASFGAFGASPAQSGSVRVGNNVGAVVARNAANNADVVLNKLNSSDAQELAGGKVTIASATGAFSFATAAQKFLVPNAGSIDFRKHDDSISLLNIDDASGIVQVSNGVLNALSQGVRTLYAAVGSLPAGAAAKDGLTAVDSTNNRFCYWSNGTRYYLATGTTF